MQLEILQYPDPRLKDKSAPVESVTDEIRQLAEDMAETMYASDGIGLAAPQVGRFIRMITVDLSGPEERADLRVYINPVINVLDRDLEEMEEGCLSVPDLRATVRRPRAIRFQATDLDGKAVDFEAEDLMAVCLQHECDHLDGVLFVDHLSALKRRLYNSKIKKRLAQQQE